jgi:hypothetical protein
MKVMTRREVLRRSAIPLVLTAGGAGVARAALGGQKSESTIRFGEVASVTASSVTVVPDGGSQITVPLVTPRGSTAKGGNPFRIGDRVVLEFDGEESVIGIEAFSDLVYGMVKEHRGDRLALEDRTLAVDGWSLARFGHGAKTSRVVALQDASLEAGTLVGVLVRRGRRGATPRVGAVFVVEEAR